MGIVFGIMDEPTPKLKWTAAEKEARRKLAIRKVLGGRTQADVADFLGVHPVTVAKWMAAYRAGGEASLAAKPVPGRPRFLSAKQEAEVRSWLLKTPTEFGFRTDLWKVVVIWDGGPKHHGPVIREFLKKNQRLRLERLPPYAPDLNPVEAVWSWLKWGRLVLPVSRTPYKLSPSRRKTGFRIGSMLSSTSTSTRNGWSFGFTIGHPQERWHGVYRCGP